MASREIRTSSREPRQFSPPDRDRLKAAGYQIVCLPDLSLVELCKEGYVSNPVWIVDKNFAQETPRSTEIATNGLQDTTDLLTEAGQFLKKEEVARRSGIDGVAFYVGGVADYVALSVQYPNLVPEGELLRTITETMPERKDTLVTKPHRQRRSREDLPPRLGTVIRKGYQVEVVDHSAKDIDIWGPLVTLPLAIPAVPGQVEMSDKLRAEVRELKKFRNRE